MTHEKIIQLLKSSNKEDNMLGLSMLSSEGLEVILEFFKTNKTSQITIKTLPWFLIPDKIDIKTRCHCMYSCQEHYIICYEHGSLLLLKPDIKDTNAERIIEKYTKI